MRSGSLWQADLDSASGIWLDIMTISCVLDMLRSVYFMDSVNSVVRVMGFFTTDTAAPGFIGSFSRALHLISAESCKAFTCTSVSVVAVASSFFSAYSCTPRWTCFHPTALVVFLCTMLDMLPSNSTGGIPVHHAGHASTQQHRWYSCTPCWTCFHLTAQVVFLCTMLDMLPSNSTGGIPVHHAGHAST